MVFQRLIRIAFILRLSSFSRLAPRSVRGQALGAFNTVQSLGLFVGGALGGWMFKGFGAPQVFLLGALAAALWLALGWHQPMNAPRAAC